MIVRSFLKWFENAPVNERIEAARAMAQALIAGQLGSDTREDAEAALMLVLDDPSVQVRRALAWELADIEQAPRAIIVALAHDQPEVAALVLARSPQLREPDLIDCAAIGSVLTQTAIALRATVSPPVCAALASVANSDALISLLRNPGAEFAADTFSVIFERHASDPELREALNQRDDLPIAVRQAILSSVSADLVRFAAGWMSPHRAERLVSETRDVATVALAADADDLEALVSQLCRTGQLTPGLLLRSLLCGEISLLGATLTHITGLSSRRVAGMMAARGQGALSAACLKAGLPGTYLPAFLAAVRAAGEVRRDHGTPARPMRDIIQTTLKACLEHDEADMGPVLALLRRYDAEAARDEARALTARMMLVEEPVTLDAAAPAFEPDFAELEQAISIDTDRPFTEAELSDARPIPVDLDRFAAELDLICGLEAAPSRDGIIADDDVMLRIDDVFGPLPSGIPADRSTDAFHSSPLRVIEDPARQLDEAYFNSWELRKSVA